MKFGFALNLSPELNKFLGLFNTIEQDISEITEQGGYGDGISELYIGIVCVAPQFEAFFRPRKPRYDEEEKEYEKEGVKYRLYKTLQYEIKLDFECLKNASEEKVKSELSKALLNSVDLIEKIKRINDFNICKFKSDLEQYFKDQGLL